MLTCHICNKTIHAPTSYKGTNYKCRDCRRKVFKTKKMSRPKCKRCHEVLSPDGDATGFCSICPSHKGPCCRPCSIMSDNTDYSCDACRHMMTMILSNTFDADLFVKGIKIALTFNENEETHDGYCSDHGPITTCNTTVVVKRFCLHAILDDEYEIIEESPYLSLYYPDNKGCQRGSGYCGCHTSYRLIKAKIITDVRAVIEMTKLVAERKKFRDSQ